MKGRLSRNPAIPNALVKGITPECPPAHDSLPSCVQENRRTVESRHTNIRGPRRESFPAPIGMPGNTPRQDGVPPPPQFANSRAKHLPLESFASMLYEVKIPPAHGPARRGGAICARRTSEFKGLVFVRLPSNVPPSNREKGEDFPASRDAATGTRGEGRTFRTGTQR